MARVPSTRVQANTRVTPLHSELVTDQTTSPAYIIDNTNIDIAGDIEMVALLSPRLPQAFGSIAARWLGGLGSNSFHWRFSNNSYLVVFETTVDGTTGTQVTATSTANMSSIIVPNVPIWVKVTRDVDNGAGGNDTAFYYAAWNGTFNEPTSWTQLGTTVTNVGTTTIHTSTAGRLDIGSFFNGGFGQWRGLFWRYILRDGIGGTVKADVKFTDMPHDTAYAIDNYNNGIVINNLVAGGATGVRGRRSRDA